MISATFCAPRAFCIKESYSVCKFKDNLYNEELSGGKDSEISLNLQSGTAGPLH